MLTYKVTKCRHGRCACAAMGWMETPWRVTRYGATYNAKTVSRWPGHGLALEAALELAGLAKPRTVDPNLVEYEDNERSTTGAPKWASVDFVEREERLHNTPWPISGDKTRLLAALC